MNKKLIYIFVILLLLICFLLFFSLNKKKTDYLILDNTLSLKYENGKFEEVEYDSLLNKKYASFSNNEFIGYYEIYNRDQNNELYMTNDESDGAYSFEHPYLFATSGIKVLEFEVEDANLDDLSYLTYDLDKYFISNIDSLDIFKKVSYDIDKDDELENIYYASYFDMEDNNSFSIVFLVKNNEVFLIGESNPFEAYDEEESLLSIDSYSLMYLLDIDNSIKMVIGMQSTDITYYEIYSFDNKLNQEFGG